MCAAGFPWGLAPDRMQVNPSDLAAGAGLPVFIQSQPETPAHLGSRAGRNGEQLG